MLLNKLSFHLYLNYSNFAPLRVYSDLTQLVWVTLLKL